MCHPANRSCSRYIILMPTLLLKWTSSQVFTLFTHVPITDQPLVTDTTCIYPTTLQATAIPTPTVATPTTSPLGTLHVTLPVNFMQDPTNSLPLMLCVLRDNNLVCLCKLVCWLSQLSRTWFGKNRNEGDLVEVLMWNSSLLFSCPWMFSHTILNHLIWPLLTIVLSPRSLPRRRFQGSSEEIWLP